MLATVNRVAEKLAEAARHGRFAAMFPGTRPEDLARTFRAAAGRSQSELDEVPMAETSTTAQRARELRRRAIAIAKTRTLICSAVLGGTNDPHAATASLVLADQRTLRDGCPDHRSTVPSALALGWRVVAAIEWERSGTAFEPKPIGPHDLNQLRAWAQVFLPLNVQWPAGDEAVYFERGVTDGLRIFRWHRAPSAREVFDERLAFQTIGFGDDPGSRSSAYGYVEFVASNPHLRPCATRFGERLTPCLIQGSDPQTWRVLWGLRALINAALVCHVRERQARRDPPNFPG